MGRNNKREKNKSYGGILNRRYGIPLPSQNIKDEDNNNRVMHKATCSECGNECEVPFKPTEGKAVYCKDCFKNKRKW